MDNKCKTEETNETLDSLVLTLEKQNKLSLKRDILKLVSDMIKDHELYDDDDTLLQLKNIKIKLTKECIRLLG